MYKLNSLDRQILCELDKDSSQPVSVLAKDLGVGRDRLSYRIKKLEQLGIITKYTASVNIYKLGVTAYKTYLRLVNDKQRINRLIQYLDRQPTNWWVAQCDGRWDMLIATFARTPKEFHNLQDDLFSRFGGIIHAFSVYTLVDLWFFRKSYFLGIGTDYFFVGGTAQNHSLKELDFNILKSLSENSRTPTTQIAEQVNSAPATVKERIKHMEDLGIITGYRVEIDLDKIGMMLFKAQVHFDEYDPRADDELREYCQLDPHITTFIQQIGDSKVELELEVESYNQFNSVMDSLRERFRKQIRGFETIMIRKSRYKHIPHDMVRGFAHS